MDTFSIVVLIVFGITAIISICRRATRQDASATDHTPANSHTGAAFLWSDSSSDDTASHQRHSSHGHDSSHSHHSGCDHASHDSGSSDSSSSDSGGGDSGGGSD